MGWTDEEIEKYTGLASSLLVLGAGISTFFCGILLPIVSRRKALIWGDIVNIIGTLLTLYPNSVAVFLTGRMIVGFV